MQHDATVTKEQSRQQAEKQSDMGGSGMRPSEQWQHCAMHTTAASLWPASLM